MENSKFISQFNRILLMSEDTTITMDTPKENKPKEQSEPAIVAQEPSPKKELPASAAFQSLQEEVAKLKLPEEKLEKSLEFMKASLDAKRKIQLRDFWDARKFCVEFFKDKIKPELRNPLWNRYRELTQEALQLRDILDEQSNFAAEQIDLAIKALEGEIQNLEQLAASEKSLDKKLFPEGFVKAYNYYDQAQKTLNVLNAYAAKINSLRKELVKTEIKIKVKNEFFLRLSAVGDAVFPMRKDKIKEISQRFQTDVDQLIQTSKQEIQQKNPLFKVRDMVKSLQGLAKVLTLNTASFNATRLALSKVWDQVKEIEKDKRKERHEKRIKQKEILSALEEKMTALREAAKETNFTLSAAEKMIDDIMNQAKTMRLGKDDWKMLRDEIMKLKQPILDRAREIEDGKRQQEKEKEKERQQAVQDLEEKIEAFFNSVADLSQEQAQSQHDTLITLYKESKATKLEKQRIERNLRRVRDKLAEKREQQVLNLSDTDQKSIEQLKGVLQDKLTRRQEIKEHLEHLRLAAGGSGLDFEKAIEFNEQLQIEKDALQELDQSIDEIKRKIKEIQAKL